MIRKRVAMTHFSCLTRHPVNERLPAIGGREQPQ